ncbi:oxidoreductase-like domain-containing protein [Pseudoalteromonas aurantia]
MRVCYYAILVFIVAMFMSQTNHENINQIPPEPKKPESDDCCGGGSCCPCVWDTYRQARKIWLKTISDAPK